MYVAYSVFYVVVCFLSLCTFHFFHLFLVVFFLIE
jgi:hypothetical protein